MREGRIKAERACKGCDGMGSVHHHGAAGSQTVKGCLACGCTGRVTDHIPAADAVADAETLARVSRALFKGMRFYRTNQFKAFQYGMSVQDVIERGFDAWHARDCASLAARAAFRAVPGLRD